MSWKKGVEIFSQVWPIIKSNMSKEEDRDEFVKKLLRIFEDHDMDPYLLEGLDSDLDELLGVEEYETDDEENVNQCIKGLDSSDQQTQLNSINALSHFVGYAQGYKANEAAEALLEILKSSDDNETKLACLKSLRSLVWEDNAIIAFEYFEELLNSGASEIVEYSQYILNKLQQ